MSQYIEPIIIDEDEDHGADAPTVIDNEDGTKTMRLSYPVEMRYRRASDGKCERTETISELTFRAGTGADMHAVENAPRGAAPRLLFCRLAGITEKTFDKLDLRDIGAGMDIVTDFLPKSPKTGPIA